MGISSIQSGAKGSGSTSGPVAYLQLTGLKGQSSPERPGWIPIESISWGVKLSDGEKIMKDYFGNRRQPEIYSAGMKDQNAVLRIKTKYVAASVIEQFVKEEMADAHADGVPGQILVSNGGGLVLFKQGYLAEYTRYPDATTGIDLQLGKDWQLHPAA
jgi:hypothetical protein